MSLATFEVLKSIGNSLSFKSPMFSFLFAFSSETSYISSRIKFFTYPLLGLVLLFDYYNTVIFSFLTSVAFCSLPLNSNKSPRSASLLLLTLHE